MNQILKGILKTLFLEQENNATRGCETHAPTKVCGENGAVRGGINRITFSAYTNDETGCVNQDYIDVTAGSGTITSYEAEASGNTLAGTAAAAADTAASSGYVVEKIIRYLEKSKLTKSKLLVKKVIDYIDSNLQDNKLDLEKIAKNVFINSSYLRKTFKKEIGMTVCDYITSVRMQKAKELLTSNNDMAISRISEVIGYSDVSYFSKCFKKYTGLSPSEYANIKK